MSAQVEVHDYGQFAPAEYSITDDYVVVFGGFNAPDPRPGSGISHSVTHDTLIYPDGEVEVEVNALTLDRLGKEQSSHIP